MAKKTRKFKTEVQQLLDLVIHSLYSKKEIFLRELVSNASDAIDRAKYEALTDKAIQVEGEEWQIELVPDKEARTLTIRDNGIGMSVEELEANIGTIANSGTRKFLEALQANKDSATPEFIGQFGVGFYSAFMVADDVELVTRRAGTDGAAVRWRSKGAGNYTLEDAEKESQGTDITLHLSEGQDEYLDEWTLKRIIKEYSDYIAVPVVMEVTKTVPAEEEGGEPTTEVETQTLNSMKAIWKKSQAEVTEEEYNDFYRHVSHDHTDPMRVIHYIAEGATEFRALLYLPSQAPFNMFLKDEHKGIHLYVKNVFITDDCKELIPDYLRFVRGVVDSSDLPLNVSREMLQDDAIIRRINKSVVGKILKELADLKEKDAEQYLTFYDEFGAVLKEGLYMDFQNGDKLKELVLFHSTQTEDGKPISLRDYVDRMPEGQKEIYYISGDSLEAARNSPHLEVFRNKGYEVLYFVDTIDEWVVQRLTEYDGKPLKAVDRGDLDLDSEEEKKEHEEKREEATKEYKDLLAYMGGKLEEQVKEVRLSSRLTDSACCLVADEMGMNAHMERIMKAMSQDMPDSKRILELNPDHPVLATMKGLFEADKESEKLANYVELLYDQALLTEGSAIKNPLRFTKLVSELMVGG
jgi:molecular chaperone HtpG